MLSTYGLACRAKEPVIKRNGLVVELLLKQGAIPFVRSNIPQMCFTVEGVCSIWGRAANPWDQKRTPGGSTGGEGGLVAARCSPLGFGTDIGGSVRIPSLYCGVYGFKPTNGRVTKIGCTSPPYNKSASSIVSSVGPIGKSVDDLRLFMKSTVTEEAFVNDRTIGRILWDEKWDDNEKLRKKLRIGYVLDDDYFAVSPANKRGVQQAVELLKKQGHECIELSLPNMKKVMLTFLAIMFSDGGMRSFSSRLQGEPFLEEYELLKKMTAIPNWSRKILMSFFNFFGEKRTAEVLEVMGGKMAYELVGWNTALLIYRDQAIQLFTENKIDGLLTPGLPTPALKHGQSKELFFSVCWTAYWNAMNFPTGALPVTQVREDEQVYIGREGKEDLFHKKAVECMEGSRGLPIGVQVTTLPFEDEKCLYIMKELESVIGFHKYPL